MIKRIHWQRWLLTALTLVGSYFIFYVLVQRPASDISIHAAWASEGSFADPTSFVHHAAHPLWHVLVALLLRIGLTLDQSAALITALCKAAQVWLLGALAAKLLAKNGWIPALCGLVGGVVSAVLVPGMNPTVYLGAGSPNPWHSPTQIMALAMMLLCVPMTASIVESFQKRLPAQGAQTNVAPREAIMLSALLVISLLAKPTFMQAFLPAACLYFLALWISKPRNGAFIVRMMLVAAPAVVVMVLQYVYYFLLFSDTQGGVMLYVSWQKTGEVLGKALLLNAFPIFMLFNNASRDMPRKPLYQLTLLMNAVSVVELLVLSETGHRASDGNFGWAMMGASLMLWAVTLPLFAQTVLAWVHRRRLANTGQPYLEAKPRAEAARLAGGGALLLWHLASGVYYIVYLLTTTNAL